MAEKLRRTLGSVQANVLDALRSHGSWYMNCGWNWTTYRFTKKVMERLVALGYACYDGRSKKFYPLEEDGP